MAEPSAIAALVLAAATLFERLTSRRSRSQNPRRYDYARRLARQSITQLLGRDPDPAQLKRAIERSASVLGSNDPDVVLARSLLEELVSFADSEKAGSYSWAAQRATLKSRRKAVTRRRAGRKKTRRKKTVRKKAKRKKARRKKAVRKKARR